MRRGIIRDVMKALCVVLWLLTGSAVSASRIPQPICYYINQAELILLVDTRAGPSYKETILIVREVLKGDATPANQELLLKSNGFYSSGDARVPLGATNIAVLLPPDWQQTSRWPVLETYLKASEIAALRVLTKVCSVTNERQRLEQVRTNLSFENPIFERELFAQLREMREPKNFDILTSLSSDPALTNKVELTKLIGDIGDLRGVPTLIEAMESPDKKISRTAIDSLRSHFPGAPGVLEAMRKATGREHLIWVAERYLAHHDSTFPAPAANLSTPWLRAVHLDVQGKKAESRAAFVAIAGDEKESIHTRLRAAVVLGKYTTEAEGRKLRKTLVPTLTRIKYTNDYGVALQAAEVLRTLRHPDCLPALLSILEPTPFTFSKAAWTSVLAINEIGEEARRTATAQVLRSLRAPALKTVFGQNTFRYPLELLWLGRESDFQEAERVMSGDYVQAWKSLQALRGIGDAKNRAAFLAEKGIPPGDLRGEANEWLILEKGQWKDKQSIADLIATLADNLDWTANERAVESLVAIGGDEVEAELLKLLRHLDINRVRRHASEALFQILGERSRNVALRVVSEEDFGWKPVAYQSLAKVGTPDDLKLLSSLADYWTGDRINHYWAMSALIQIRERWHYDINGPVQPRR